MNNTNIIPGMTDVINYIKKQEEQIKDLKSMVATCKQDIEIRDTEIKELKGIIARDSDCGENISLQEELRITKENAASKIIELQRMIVELKNTNTIGTL